MTALALLRALVFLRRISKELIRSNEIAEARLNLERERLALEFPAWHKAGGKVPSAPRMAVIGKLDVDEVNRTWKETHPGQEKRRP